MNFNFLDRSKIPHKSGVYIYKDSSGKILYVGKAIDLYSRVSSYFSGEQTAKTAALVEKIADLETIIVESELEALILEANLIKKFRPSFNIRLTDDKDYLYIGITKENFPKVITARKADLKSMKKFWGPFPSGRTVRDTLKRLRKVFPWCNSKIKDQKSNIKNSRACFYYHLGLCPGTCVGAINKKDYNNIMQRFSKFMDGKKAELVNELVKEMENASSQQKYEEANSLKKVIEGINYLTQINRVASYLQNPNFLEGERQLGLEHLQKDLNLEKLPERIEGYDISNISGKDATGSMVVLTQGDIDKSQYRKFKIYLSARPNDVGMHKEMIRRRLKHKEWPMPDLIIIDGGRGQARGVNLEIRRSELEIPVFGLAKRMEWLYPPEGEVIKLSKKSLSLKLLQKLRDESHRFAISYHRKLRDKHLLRTSV